MVTVQKLLSVSTNSGNDMVLYLCIVVKRVQDSLLYCCCNSELFNRS